MMSWLLSTTWLSPRTAILLGVAIVITALTFRSLRAHRLKERYVLLFLFTGLPFLVLAIWPDGVLFLQNTLEIEKPTLLTLFVAIYFLLTTFLLLSIVSVQERKIDQLAQIIAINGLASASHDTPTPPSPRSADD